MVQHLFRSHPLLKVAATALIVSFTHLYGCQSPNASKTSPEVQPEQNAPKVEPFSEALNRALTASKQTQSAKTAHEWQVIVDLWQKSIDLMKDVPTTSQNYGMAQQKIIEYGVNAEYALTQVSKASFIDFAEKVKSEASKRAEDYQETHSNLWNDCTNECGLQQIEVVDEEIRIFFRPVPKQIAIIKSRDPQSTKEILDFASPFKKWLGPKPEKVPQDVLACALELPYQKKVAIYGVDNQNNVIVVWRPCLKTPPDFSGLYKSANNYRLISSFVVSK